MLRPGDEESYLVADGCLSMETKKKARTKLTKNTLCLRGRGTEIIQRTVLEIRCLDV